MKVEAKAREDAAGKVQPHVDTVPLDVDTHSLRHFYASALIAGGASVKVVQTRLGHGSAVVTLNTYGHLWPGDDDLTRTVMDVAFGPRRTLCGLRGCRRVNVQVSGL